MKKRVQITIDIGEANVIDLKIVSGKMIGILHIEKEGLAFSPPKTKKEPTSRVDWDRLSSLIISSNGKAHTTKKD